MAFALMEILPTGSTEELGFVSRVRFADWGEGAVGELDRGVLALALVVVVMVVVMVVSEFVVVAEERLVVIPLEDKVDGVSNAVGVGFVIADVGDGLANVPTEEGTFDGFAIVGVVGRTLLADS
jgi:hypothetical protein